MRLGGKQIRRVYDIVTTKNSLQFKLTFALWTQEQIRTLIARRFNAELSLVSVARFLAQRGLIGQRPPSRAYRQHRSSVERWLKEEYPKVRAQAGREKVESFFEDESGVRSDFRSGTTWVPKGKTPIVRATGERFSPNMTSRVSAPGGFRFMVVRRCVGATVFIVFLERVMSAQRRPIYLIIDGQTSNRANKVKIHVESLDGKPPLFLLPPHSLSL